MYRFPSFKHSNQLFFHEQYDGVKGKMFWWIMKKINFWLWAGWVASYLQRSLSARVNGGVQMPPLTSENSHFLRSGPQEATVVMKDEVIINRLRIGHTRLTHSFRMENRPHPLLCDQCEGDHELTLKHILIECNFLKIIRRRHYDVTDLNHNE